MELHPPIKRTGLIWASGPNTPVQVPHFARDPTSPGLFHCVLNSFWQASFNNHLGGQCVLEFLFGGVMFKGDVGTLLGCRLQRL